MNFETHILIFVIIHSLFIILSLLHTIKYNEEKIIIIILSAYIIGIIIIFFMGG